MIEASGLRGRFANGKVWKGLLWNYGEDLFCGRRVWVYGMGFGEQWSRVVVDMSRKMVMLEYRTDKKIQVINVCWEGVARTWYVWMILCLRS